MDRSLSPCESRLVLDLEWRNQETVTLSEIGSALGASAGYARKLAHGLVKIPASRGCDGVADTDPFAVGPLLVSPYFLGITYETPETGVDRFGNFL